MRGTCWLFLLWPCCSRTAVRLRLWLAPDRSARTTPGRLPVSPVAHNLADRQVPVLSAQGSWRGGALANYTVQIVCVAPESNCDLFQTDVMSGRSRPTARPWRSTAGRRSSRSGSSSLARISATAPKLSALIARNCCCQSLSRRRPARSRMHSSTRGRVACSLGRPTSAPSRRSGCDRRQGELKADAAGQVRARPQASAMRLNNGPADR